LGRTRLMVLGAVGIGLVLLLVVGLSQVTKPSFSPLYSGLSASDASEMVRTLEQAGIEVEVTPDSSVISVPRSEFARARMALADQGLPSQGAPGWELFDQGSGLGMNSFMQRVNHLRAREGELARSIQTISGVDAARVHLVLPEREAFSRERAEPSASVVLRTRSGTLDKKQATSIQYLVSSAVPGLSPAKVTVLSADGSVIAAENDDGNSEASLQSTKAQLEDRYARRIEKILSARVGAGNVRAEVSVDLTTERRVVVSESFNPSEQVVRSTETQQESEEGIEAGSSDVSVANNLPETLLGGGQSGPQSKNSRNKSNEIVNYEIGNTRSETIYEPGDVERISVAVIVNGIFDQDGNYIDREADELSQLEELTRTAIGFDTGRNDAVSVTSLRFMDYSMEIGEPVKVSALDILSENIMTIVKWIISLIMVTLVLLLGVRPIMARIAPPTVEAASDLDETGEADAAGEDGKEAAEGGASKSGGKPKADGDGDDETDETVEMAQVTGGVRKKRLNSLGALVESEEAEALKLLRVWIGSTGQAGR
jgi:flagellar M-ring protein FliF